MGYVGFVWCCKLATYRDTWGLSGSVGWQPTGKSWYQKVGVWAMWGLFGAVGWQGMTNCSVVTTGQPIYRD